MPLLPGLRTMLGSADPPAAGPDLPAPLVMPDVAVILRKVTLADLLGTAAVVWSIVATEGCLLLREVGAAEAVEGAALEAVSRWQARFRKGADVRPQDTVTINGVGFEVTDADAGPASTMFLSASLVRLR